MSFNRRFHFLSHLAPHFSRVHICVKKGKGRLEEVKEGHDEVYNFMKYCSTMLGSGITGVLCVPVCAVLLSKGFRSFEEKKRKERLVTEQGKCTFRRESLMPIKERLSSTILKKENKKIRATLAAPEGI